MSILKKAKQLDPIFIYIPMFVAFLSLYIYYLYDALCVESASVQAYQEIREWAEKYPPVADSAMSLMEDGTWSIMDYKRLEMTYENNAKLELAATIGNSYSEREPK